MSQEASPPTPTPRTVKCPNCGGDSVYASSNPFRPFCCARCKNIDFGAWASESFRIEAPPASKLDEQSGEPFTPD